jgi:hypothetical protein
MLRHNSLLEVQQRFRGACCFPQLPHVDAVITSETSVSFYETKQHSTREDNNPDRTLRVFWYIPRPLLSSPFPVCHCSVGCSITCDSVTSGNTVLAFHLIARFTCFTHPLWSIYLLSATALLCVGLPVFHRMAVCLADSQRILWNGALLRRGDNFSEYLCSDVSRFK